MNDYPHTITEWVATLPVELDGRPLRTLEFGSEWASAFAAAGLRHTVVDFDRCAGIPDGVDIVTARRAEGWFDWRPPFGTLFDVILLGRYASMRSRAVDRVPPLLAEQGAIAIVDADRPSAARITAALAADLGLARTRFSEHVLLQPMPDSHALADGPGGRLYSWLHRLGVPACRRCRRLALQMNDWGEQGCRDHRDEIINEILPHAVEWWRSKRPWMRAKAWFISQPSLHDALAAARCALSGDVESLIRQSVAHVVDCATDGSLTRQ